MAAPSSTPTSSKPRAGGRKSGVAGGRRAPTEAQLVWLRRGLLQPGGKLPLFDDSGQRVSSSVIGACQRAGWAEPWFQNPIKPTWEVCRLTDAGRAMLARVSVVTVDFRKGRAVPPGP
ncbi:MAG: hypothetical protein WCO00_14465 [Rhodospirillaceae bacterium]